ncbi:MAG TPA: hypothetical protein VJ385_00045 [Fibrobacteria bacterium]|nr:hypothetical protein [Fibrobacteria bacterium]
MAASKANGRGKSPRPWAWLLVPAFTGMPLPAQAMDLEPSMVKDRPSSPRGEGLAELPLDSLRNGQTLVAGERLSNFWSDWDSTIRTGVYFQGGDSTWRMMKKADPVLAGLNRKNWRLPTDVVGRVKLRINDAASGKILVLIDANILPPAGSPATGPFLESPLHSRDPKGRVGKLPFLSSKEFVKSQFRLGAASGGRKCLPDFQRVIQFALEDRDGAPDGNGISVLSSRVKYHFWNPEKKTVQAGESQSAGFLSGRAKSNRVFFMLEHEYHYSNFKDSIARIDIRVNGNSISLTPGKRVEYVFPKAGVHGIILHCETTSGASWDIATALEVLTVLSPEFMARQRKMEKISGLPIESELSGVTMRTPEEVDSLNQLEKMQNKGKQK